MPDFVAEETQRTELQTLDPQVTTIQPGGGICMQIELAWGALRRAYLKTFRRGYVRKMAELRQGTQNVCPHEVLDPRDVKFYQNQGGYYWRPEDDPFTWRDRLPFARAGLAELIILSVVCFGATAVLAYYYWPAAIVPAVFGLFFVSFFRNPNRTVPAGAGVVVSPADGKVTTIEEIEHDEFIGGPAVLIGIFLSIFNVHVNRVPVPARVIGIVYRKGKFLNAMRAESARENEQLAVRIEENRAPYRRMTVRQITGAIARRIVCWVKPGDELAAGELFGMIKLGSRTELVLPREEGLEIVVKMGQTVKAGSTIFARYPAAEAEEPAS